MLQIENLTVRLGATAVLDNASVALPDRARTALVGRNGAGKSTLLRAIAGEIAADEGSIALPPRARVGMMAQSAPDGAETPIEVVLAADRERAALLAEAETAHEPERISAVHTRLAEIGAHTAPARAAAILAGLGLDAAMQAQPCKALSGGWRSRVALAAALFAEPDLLLLDEPSNHLDLEATLWLTGFLRRYPRNLVLVSHDRDLLDAVADRIVHLERGKLTPYTGNYTSFVRTRAERAALAAKSAARQSAERDKMEAFVARFRAKASKARQAQSRLKALARMEPVALPAGEEPVAAIGFPEPEPLPSPLLSIDDASVGYAAADPVLRKLTLRVDADDRIVLLGRNGNGKSTLARLIAGRLKPMEGTVRGSSKLRIGYFAQHQAEELDFAATAFQHLSRLEPGTPDARLRAHLGRFGFSGNKANLAVGRLSGGETARLLFALMSRAAPNLLVIDEPTNHLDIETRDALIAALNEFQGAVVLVTHDARLVELAADRLWLVDGGTCAPFDGDLDDYRRFLASGPASGQNSARDADERKAQRRAAADERSRKAPLRRAVKDAEAALERSATRLRDIDAELARPDSYDGPKDALETLLKRQGDARRTLAEAEERWFAAQAALDAVDAG